MDNNAVTETNNILSKGSSCTGSTDCRHDTVKAVKESGVHTIIGSDVYPGVDTGKPEKAEPSTDVASPLAEKTTIYIFK